MLILERTAGQSIVIYPDHSVDPQTTVGELFANGPIRLSVRYKGRSPVKLAVDAPRCLKVLRHELELTGTFTQVTAD